MENFKRITLLCGHYGSGKTNIAVNMAYELKKKYSNVAIADLDIVNPYFRTKDSIKEFEKRDIKLICSKYAGSNVDIPALPQEMYALTDDRQMHCIIDVGGDDRGALALGRLSPAIKEENDYDMLMVINCYRPLTRDVPSTINIMREIETASGIKFTGLINNSNLGKLTTKQTVIDSLKFADGVSKASGLPIFCTAVKQGLFDRKDGSLKNVFPIELQENIY
ncbi:MAG: hypothetical protein MJ076_00195 [Clostridia bacterium]|nr:hypothetical protein [Clostridia bacterium]